MSRLSGKDLFRKLVRELIKQELDEANSTASVGGEYSTPHAFKGRTKKVRKKVRPVTKVVIQNQPMELVIFLLTTRS